MYLTTWEEFQKSAEALYLQDPMKIRFAIKYTPTKKIMKVKLTDNVTCLQYKTELAQDFKKIERFIMNLMRHMASKE